MLPSREIPASEDVGTPGILDSAGEIGVALGVTGVEAFRKLGTFGVMRICSVHLSSALIIETERLCFVSSLVGQGNTKRWDENIKTVSMGSWRLFSCSEREECKDFSRKIPK